ncbi:hypothetical protein T440DRAFT_405923, partial [Plenodomus tracheiphilus IPT5]
PYPSLNKTSPLLPRPDPTSLAPKLLATITELSSTATDLTTAVYTCSGSYLHLLPEAFAVVRADTKVNTTISKEALITKDSSIFSADDNSQTVQALVHQIGPIQSSLEALKGKYREIMKTLLSLIVSLALKMLHSHTDSLLSALEEKVTSNNIALLGLGKTILDGVFHDAVALYSA